MAHGVSSRDARYILAGVAMVLAFVQFLPLYTGGFSSDMTFLGTHLGATLAITFLLFGIRGSRGEKEYVPISDLVLVGIALACGLYLVTQAQRISERIAAVDEVYTLDYFFGILLVLVLLEACRRVAGLVLTLVAIVFVAYIFAGPYLPAFIAHRGISVKRFVDLQILTTAGIFGTPLSASAHLVFYFLIVGTFLERSGAGQLFVSMAYSMTARSWGGSGKAAVVSSGLFGMVSGSSTANVLLSGVMTIPLMKRAGFKPDMAAAIEATSSTGGQLMPPIMGAAAFIMADFLGIPYVQVVIAAIIPAILYYGSIFALIHFHARRQNMKPDYLTPIRQHLDGLRSRWHLLLPLAIMVGLLLQRYSLMTVGAITIVSIIVAASIRRATRMSLRAIFNATVTGVSTTVGVSIPSAVAGIIVGTLVHTGLALRLQRFLLDLAGGSLMISLIGAMIITLILGMGMPTSAAYIMSAILVAPALIELGVHPVAAHLFILYFSILSMVTPPVAITAYAAAGLAKSDLWRTGMIAFLLAVPGFIVPFAFVFNPNLILQGGFVAAIPVLIPAVLGVICLAVSCGGYVFGPLSMPLRVLMFIAGPLMIDPHFLTDVVGAAIAMVVICYQLWTGARFRIGKAPVNSTD